MLYLLLDWSLYYVLPFFASYYGLHFSLLSDILNECRYSSFLLVSISMKHLFPVPSLSIYVCPYILSRSLVCNMQIFFNLLSHFMSFDWRGKSIIFGVIIDRCILITMLLIASFLFWVPSFLLHLPSLFVAWLFFLAVGVNFCLLILYVH